VTTESRATPDLDSTARTSSSRRKQRRIWLALLAAVAAALAASAALAARDGLRVERDVRGGRAAFHSLLHRGLTSGSNLQTQARAGAALFRAAEKRARTSPWVRGWSHVPLVGQPARWLIGASSAAAGIADDAAAVIAEVEPKLNAAHDPAQRLAFLDTLAAEFGRLRGAVDAIHVPAPGFLLPPVNNADRELKHELARLRSTIDAGAVAARGLRSFLGGPTTYMVLAGNNAEMRAGGMVLQAGILRASDGRLSTGEFRTTADLTLKHPAQVPPELAKLYGWLEPGSEWRNVGSSPDFPAVGPLYAAMAERSTLGPADGAIQLDVPGLRSLLSVIGGVEVDGRRYNAANVERLIMHDLYVAFRADQIPRHHELSALAQKVFRALTDRRWDPRALIKALGDAAAGRHLMLWSTRPVEETAWRRLGVDGSLTRDGLMVTIQNHTGNKLDWFLRPSVDLTVDKLPGDYRRVHVRIHIVNPAPRGQPRYVVGDGRLVPVGAYRALVAVYLPGGAINVSMPGRTVALVGPDGPMRVVGTRIDIPRMGSADVSVVFDLPPDARTIDLLPSGRVPPIELRLRGRTVDDAIRRRIRL